MNMNTYRFAYARGCTYIPYLSSCGWAGKYRTYISNSSTMSQVPRLRFPFRPQSVRYRGDCHFVCRRRTSFSYKQQNHPSASMGKGQLLFKGERPKKKSKKSKHSSNRNSNDDNNLQDDENEKHVVHLAEGIDHSTAVPAVASRPLTSTPSVATATATAPPISIMKQGTGKITTSGTVVTGYETRFEKELQAGDAILCTLGNGGTEELRVVTMRLSNISLNLSSAFSTNIKTPTSFQYIRKPRDVHKERAEAHKRTTETLREQKTHAFDLYGNDSLVYREKTETGSYRIKREPLSVAAGTAAAARTRGDLLEMRAKKTSDKFC